MVDLGSGPSSVRVPVPGQPGAGAEGAGRVVLRLEGVGAEGGNPGVGYAVYVSHPDQGEGGSYVGNVSFYGRRGARSTQELDVTEAVRSVGAPDVRVRFEPIGFEGEAPDAAGPGPLASIDRVHLTAQ